MKRLIITLFFAVILAVPTRAGTVILSWTAPGDDSTSGTATSYDLRCSTNRTTIEEWTSAVQIVGEPEPDIAGTRQTYRVVSDALTPETKYYFAIKTADETFIWHNNPDSSVNWSELSNIAEKTAMFTHPYPNPLNPTAATMLFSDIPEGAGVVIVDISGQTVRHFIDVTGGHVTWDGKNQATQPVSAGIYLWYIPGTSYNGKIRVVN